MKNIFIFMAWLFLVSFLIDSENFTDEKKTIIESGKAIMWMVTAPICEVRNNCETTGN